jgi:hypothetical protein
LHNSHIEQDHTVPSDLYLSSQSQTTTRRLRLIFEVGDRRSFLEIDRKKEAHSTRVGTPSSGASRTRGDPRWPRRTWRLWELGVIARKRSALAFCVSYFILRREFQMF